MCDSCYEEYGPKGAATTQQGGSSSSGESSPVKTSRGGGGGRHHRNKQHSHQGGMDADLPAEYLSSPLSKEVSLKPDADTRNMINKGCSKTLTSLIP